MDATLAGRLQILALVGAPALSHRPLGDHVAHVLTTGRHLRVERLAYRLGGVDGDADQRWPVYLRSVLAFSAVSMLFRGRRPVTGGRWPVGGPPRHFVCGGGGNYGGPRAKIIRGISPRRPHPLPCAP